MERAARWIVASAALLCTVVAPFSYGQEAPIALPDPATGKLIMADARGQRIDVESVDYRQALASETLCPAVVILDGSRIAPGHNEASVIRKLGAPSRVPEPAHRRSREENVQYFRELMFKHPNTMHYYALLPLQESEGWFKLVEWDSTPVGTIRAYLKADSASGPFLVQLLHVVLPPINPADVRSVPGQEMLLERQAPPGLTWNVSTNTISRLSDQRIPPDDISGTYRRDHMVTYVVDQGVQETTVTDVLMLSLETDGRLRFSFELAFDNFHTCTMEGVATRVGDYFEYREPIQDSRTGAQECVLRFRSTVATISLQDVERGCGWGAGYCGVRGVIDGLVFSREQSVSAVSALVHGKAEAGLSRAPTRLLLPLDVDGAIAPKGVAVNVFHPDPWPPRIATSNRSNRVRAFDGLSIQGLAGQCD